MANDSNLISKLTKKLKINKKKKNSWKNLNSSDNLPYASEDYMLYSDTEAELYKARVSIKVTDTDTYNAIVNINNEDDEFYKAKVNVAANRSFNNSTSFDENNENINTSNILGALRKSPTYSPGVISRSSTYNDQSSVGSSQHSTLQNKFLYPGTLNRNNFTSEIKTNSNNPFKNTNTIRPKGTQKKSIKQRNSPSTMDPALSNSLISPIEFDSTGNEIKSTISSENPTLSSQSSTKDSTLSRDSKQSNSPKQSNSVSNRAKSVKRIKPLITFDTPPVVSPITVESDSDEYVRKRNSKKAKKYSKKRSHNEKLKPTEFKETKTNVSTADIVARANMRLNSSRNNEEDDDVPLGIIQYKCLSSLLNKSTPSNISSLQSNTQYKSTTLSRDNNRFPPETAYYSDKESSRRTNYNTIKKRNEHYNKKLNDKSTKLFDVTPLSPPPSPKQTSNTKNPFTTIIFDSDNTTTNVNTTNDIFTSNNNYNITSNVSSNDDKFASKEDLSNYFNNFSNSNNISNNVVSLNQSPIPINYSNSNMNANMKKNMIQNYTNYNSNMNMTINDYFKSNSNTNASNANMNPFEAVLRNREFDVFDEFSYKTY